MKRARIGRTVKIWSLLDKGTPHARGRPGVPNHGAREVETPSLVGNGSSREIVNDVSTAQCPNNCANQLNTMYFRPMT